MANSSVALSSVMDDRGFDSRTVLTERSFNQLATTPQTGDDDTKMKSASEESFLDEEIIPPPNGRLTKSIVSKFLSNLGRAGDATTFAYRDLELISLNLNDIGALSSFQFIRHLNISNNNLTTLVVLSNMRWLVTLIASHNQIETLLDFAAPQALRHVDFSYNAIRVMDNLNEHVYVETLILDHNDILEIGGLENCRRLKELRLSHNRITALKSLGVLPIQKLDLSYNALTKIESLDGLELLCELDLSGNRIRSLQGINCHSCLTILDLSNNEIIDISELEHLRSLYLLNRGEFSLNLNNNPVCELPDFRLLVMHRFPNLATLNNKRARAEEKVSASYAFSPTPEHVAAVNHSILTVYSFLQPAALEMYTLPDPDMCYPMLVIVGPDGSGREYLMMRLATEFADVFSTGSLCTTRPLYTDELDGREFSHVPMELFDSQVKAGQFLSIYNMGQHVFGFHKQSLEQAATTGTACVTHMELEGMLCLRLVTSLRPRYVLVVPLDPEAQDNRLRGRNVYTDDQIQDSLKRRDFYIKYHQKHPGYFDAVISSDNLEDAYVKLKSLVLDYLGRDSSRMPTKLPGEDVIVPLAAVTTGDDATDLKQTNASITGGLVQRGGDSPSSNTHGTERSLYRIRYEALQRVMSGGRRSGLKELMGSSSPRRHRQTMSAGGRSVGSVVVPPRNNKSPTQNLRKSGGPVFGVTANGVELLNSASLDDERFLPKRKIANMDDDSGGDGDSDDLALDSTGEGDVRNRVVSGVQLPLGLLKSSGSVRSSDDQRLGSARYDILPPIRSVTDQAIDTTTPKNSKAKQAPAKPPSGGGGSKNKADGSASVKVVVTNH